MGGLACGVSGLKVRWGRGTPLVSPLDLLLQRVQERSVGSVLPQRLIIGYESQEVFHLYPDCFLIMSYLEEGLFHDEAGDGVTDIPGYDVLPLQGMMGMKGLLLFKMAEGV